MPAETQGRPRGAWVALLVALGACFLVAAIGGLVTGQSVGTWYATLRKPAWTPPRWLFSPVWTVLYAMMAVAAWRVWMQRSAGPARPALIAFAVQLTLNLLWSILFFGGRSIAAGLVDIALLWCAILATTILFFRVSGVAGWLMTPYLAWVTYAAALNFALWRMNG